MPLPPAYRYHVFCCLNARPEGHELGCCASKDSEKIFNYLKARVKELALAEVRINRAGCLDACAGGPVMVVYPQGVWYTVPTLAAAEQMLQEHIVERGVATALLVKTA